MHNAFFVFFRCFSGAENNKKQYKVLKNFKKNKILSILKKLEKN